MYSAGLSSIERMEGCVTIIEGDISREGAGLENEQLNYYITIDNS